EHIRSRERRRFDRQSVARPPRSAGVNPAPQKRIGAVTLWGRLYAGQRCIDRHSRGVTALVGRGKPGPTKKDRRRDPVGAGFTPASGVSTGTAVARPPRSAGVNPAPQRIGAVTLWGR